MTRVSHGVGQVKLPPPNTTSAGILSPLTISIYRRIWTASLLTNFGMLVLGVGAAWIMTQLTDKPSMVALVQTALMLSLMLWSIPAGALADMYDHRKIALAGLCFSSANSAILCVLAWQQLLTPIVVLTSCFLIGSGMAAYSPAWQSSVTDQVPAESLPHAIALNSISYNIARSFGPALGGFVVAIFGAVGAFSSTALLYLPLITRTTARYFHGDVRVRRLDAHFATDQSALPHP